MKVSTRKALNDCSGIDAIQGFTCKLKHDMGVHSPNKVDRSQVIVMQVSRQMEPVRSFMDTLQHFPIIGTLIKLHSL